MTKSHLKSYCAEGGNPTSKLGITEAMGGNFFQEGGVALILSLSEGGLKLILLNERGL